MTPDMIVALIVAVSSVAASSGIWKFIQSRSEIKSTIHDAQTRLLMGLAYDKIMTLGMAYIDRGYITKDEYEEYLKYLVAPYKEMGGNGVAERVSKDVGMLPFRAMEFKKIIVKAEEEETDD